MKKRVIRFLVSFLCIGGVLLNNYSVLANATNYYAGTVKPDGKAIEATIKPIILPYVGNSGESCWVSNCYDGGSVMLWLQTGIRYYNGYSSFKTYVEYKQSSTVYQMEELNTHSLSTAKTYKVQFENDGKWHAYISGIEKKAIAFSFVHATIEAMAEAHSPNIQMGPFYFTNVRYKNLNGTWTYMDVTPYADSPYSDY